MRKKAEMELKQADVPEKADADSSSPGQNGTVEHSGVRKKKVNPIKIRQMKERIGKLEEQIHLHETRVAVLNRMLASEELYRDHQLFRSTMQEHDRLQAELTRLMAQWEGLNAELEAMQ